MTISVDSPNRELSIGIDRSLATTRNKSPSVWKLFEKSYVMVLFKKVGVWKTLKSSINRFTPIEVDAAFNALSNETNRRSLRHWAAKILTKYR
jgi:hypothetical protein